MATSSKQLDYLNLEVKSDHRIKVEQFNLPCFSKSSVEHLVHTKEHPQLNLIVDLLLLVVQQQKQLLFSDNSSSSSTKVLREVHDKLEYLRGSLSSYHLKSIAQLVQKLEVSLQIVEKQTQQCNQLLKQIHEKLL